VTSAFRVAQPPRRQGLLPAAHAAVHVQQASRGIHRSVPVLAGRRLIRPHGNRLTSPEFDDGDETPASVTCSARLLLLISVR